jgi:hypothetical protein
MSRHDFWYGVTVSNAYIANALNLKNAHCQKLCEGDYH